jgi:multidrug efflux pump subunit AcrA (membrane-fusion protein)
VISVIDPRTMRFEASVPAEQIGDVTLGQTVDFKVTGYGDRAFSGKVSRLAPVTNAATGQVDVTVTIPNLERTLIGGLHAEGRIVTQAVDGPVVALAAVDRRAMTPRLVVLRGGVVQAVPVKLGLVDELGERAQIAEGAVAGDIILFGAAQAIAPGTRAQIVAAQAGR